MKATATLSCASSRWSPTCEGRDRYLRANVTAHRACIVSRKTLATEAGGSTPREIFSVICVVYANTYVYPPEMLNLARSAGRTARELPTAPRLFGRNTFGGCVGSVCGGCVVTCSLPPSLSLSLYIYIYIYLQIPKNMYTDMHAYMHTDMDTHVTKYTSTYPPGPPKASAVGV